ncbi:MAG TPA: CBS domain-containing protein [Acidimicrobiia bacterium]|nr:CBS domain-containing protein [Acidimicrobiia bacterium]
MKVRVRDVMTASVVTIGPDVPLKEAAVLMGRHRISGLPVVDGDRLVGIITESDFVSRLAVDGGGLLAALLGRKQGELGGTVGQAMTPEPLTIGPDESVAAAARAMSEHSVKRLPVLSREGQLVGLVSRADLMSVFARPDERIESDIVNEGVVGLIGADRDAVKVRVEGGVVHLSGTVGSVTEKRMLEEFSRRVAGVVTVESQLGASIDDTRLPPV